MKKIIIILFVLMSSCSRGIWISQNGYRAKKPSFSILKESFVYNDLIDIEYIYISSKKKINYDGKEIFNSIGFYKDGRIVINTYTNDNLEFQINTTNSWDTAAIVGYYTTNSDKIKIQFFISNDGGLYEIKKGAFNKDTIVFEEKINLLLKSEIRYDTLVKSKYKLK
jgi:hypothetical protein